jgi:hypothetical protein
MVQHLHLRQNRLREFAALEDRGMSRRFPKSNDDSQPQPQDFGLTATPASDEALPADHSRSEPKLLVSGAAFQQFDGWIDAELDALVGRWIHTAAPAASRVRRVVPQTSHSEET